LYSQPVEVASALISLLFFEHFVFRFNRDQLKNFSTNTSMHLPSSLA